MRIDSWQIVSVSEVRDGAILVEMKPTGGAPYQVELMRRDAGNPGIARTAAVELYLCNEGDGNSRSIEAHGLGVMALAKVLSAREAAGAPVPQLLTMQERAAQFPRYAPVRA